MCVLWVLKPKTRSFFVVVYFQQSREKNNNKIYGILFPNNKNNYNNNFGDVKYTTATKNTRKKSKEIKKIIKRNTSGYCRKKTNKVYWKIIKKIQKNI